MNKELIIKKKEYEKEEIELYFTISQIESVLKKQTLFKTKESIEALIKIKNYLQEKNKRLEILNQEQKQLTKKIKQECQHEIILKTDYNTNCCLCNRLFLTPPTFEHILLEYDEPLTPTFYKTIDESINEIITNNQTLLDNFENNITKKIQKIRLYRRTK